MSDLTFWNYAACAGTGCGKHASRWDNPPKVRWCVHDATQRYARPSRFRIPCSVRIPRASASVLNENLGAGGDGDWCS